ncbi:hypothetical protein LCGC14_1532280, partial [marine sediment metagenome]
MTVNAVEPKASGHMRWPIVTGAFLALTAVMAGAFGAHALRNLV